MERPIVLLELCSTFINKYFSRFYSWVLSLSSPFTSPTSIPTIQTIYETRKLHLGYVLLSLMMSQSASDVEFRVSLEFVVTTGKTLDEASLEDQLLPNLQSRFIEILKPTGIQAVVTAGGGCMFPVREKSDPWQLTSEIPTLASRCQADTSSALDHHHYHSTANPSKSFARFAKYSNRAALSSGIFLTFLSKNAVYMCTSQSLMDVTTSTSNTFQPSSGLRSANLTSSILRERLTLLRNIHNRCMRIPY
jgi:hypothetical protein